MALLASLLASGVAAAAAGPAQASLGLLPVASAAPIAELLAKNNISDNITFYSKIPALIQIANDPLAGNQARQEAQALLNYFESINNQAVAMENAAAAAAATQASSGFSWGIVAVVVGGLLGLLFLLSRLVNRKGRGK